MLPRHLAFAGIIFVLGALPGQAASQEFGVLAGHGSSDFPELGSPSSLAAQLSVPLDRRKIVRLVGAYRLRLDRGERPGTVCDFYWPVYSACTEEPVAHDTRLTQMEAGMAVGFPLTERIEARVSAVRVRSALKGSSKGAVTGRDPGSFYPDEPVWSTAGVGGLAWRPRTTIPLSLVAQFRIEKLNFRGCATDVGIPFCNENTLATLEAGLAWTR
jgi:hypothetical protein